MTKLIGARVVIAGLENGLELTITAASMSFISDMFGVLAVCILLVTFALVYGKTWKLIIRSPLNFLTDVFYRRLAAVNAGQVCIDRFLGSYAFHPYRPLSLVSQSV